MEDMEIRELGEQFRFISSVRNIIPPLQNKNISSSVNLIASASKFGLVFVAFGCELKVYRTCDLIDEANRTPFGVCTIAGRITHLAVNCDNLTLLAGGNNLDGLPFGFFFDIRVFVTKSRSYDYFYAVPLSSIPSSCIESICWNPTVPECVAVAINTGEISLIQLKDKSVIFTTLAVGASFVTWSAKGKQLAVGTIKGTLELFKTDLAPVRSVQPPNLPDIGTIVSINWFSNTEFFVCYRKNSSFPALFVVTAPRNAAATYINLDDICYSGEQSTRPHSYYSTYIFEWNLLFALSSHGSDMGMLGKSVGNPNTWIQWVPEEGNRASLQFINVVEETFPLGFCSVFSSKKRFVGKDEQMKGPFPVLLSLTTGGQLNIFHIENNISENKLACIIAEPIPTSGARTSEQYGTIVVKIAPPPSPPPNPAIVSNMNLTASTPISPQISTGVPQNTVQPNSPFSGGQFTAVGKPTFGAIVPQTSTPKPTTGQNFANVLSPGSQANFQVPSGNMPSPLSGQLLKTHSGIGPQSPFNSQTLETKVNVASPSPFTNQAIQNKNVSQTSTFQNNSFGQTQQTNIKIATPAVVGQPQQINVKNTTPVVGGQPVHSSSIGSQFTIQHHSKIGSPLTFTGQPVNTSAVAAAPSIVQPSVKTQINGQTSVPAAGSVAVPSSSLVANKSAEKKLSNGTSKRIQTKLLRSITEELLDFENELVLHERTNTKVFMDIGDEADKKAISDLLSHLEKWMIDMKLSIDEQNSDISLLHEGTLENCTLYEDASAQFISKKSIKNQTYAQLRPLDPYTRRKLDEIRAKYQYLRTQISDVNAMLDSEWQNYNFDNHEKLKEYGGGNSEKINRSALHLRKRRQLMEAQIERVCKLMKCHNLGTFLLPPDDTNDPRTTVSGLPDTPRIGGKISSKAMDSLQRMLSERKQTPVRHFSTPKRNISMNDSDVALKLNLEESSTPEEWPKQNPLIALKSFVSQTSTDHTDKASILGKALAAPHKSPLINSASSISSNMQAIPQNRGSSGIVASKPLNSQLGVSAGQVVSSSAGGINIFSNGSFTSAGGIFLPAGSPAQAAISKPKFAVATTLPAGTQAEIAQPVLPSPNTGKAFTFAFTQPAVQPKPTSMTSVKPLAVANSNQAAPNPAIDSARLKSQSPFTFNTNLSTVNSDHSSQQPNVNIFGSTSVNQLVSKPETSFSQLDKQSLSCLQNNSQINISVIPNKNDDLNSIVKKINVRSDVSISAIPMTSQSSAEVPTTKSLFGTYVNESTAVATQPNNFGNVSIFSTAAGVKPSIETCAIPTFETSGEKVQTIQSNVSNNGIVSQPTNNVSSDVQTFGSGVLPNIGKLSSLLTAVQPATLTKPQPSFSFLEAAVEQVPVSELSQAGNDKTTSSIPTHQNSTAKDVASVSISAFGNMTTPASSVSTFKSDNLGSATPTLSIESSRNQLTSPHPSTHNADGIQRLSSKPGDGVSSNVFGGTAATASTFAGAAATSNSSASVGVVTSPNGFGDPSKNNIFPSQNVFGGAPVSNSSIFSAAPVSSAPSIFGGSSTTTKAFEQTTFGTNANSGSGPFNSNSFGGACNKPFGTENSIFGGNAPQNPSSSAFGNSAVAGGTSIFGKSMPSDDAAPPTNVGFGSTNAASGAFGIGGNTAATFGGGSVFGGSTSVPPAFGSNTNQASKGFGLFGNNAGSTSTEEQSAFSGLKICSDLGGNPDAAKSSQNVFGSPASSTNINTNLFSGNQAAQTGTAFGSPKTTASAFGGAPAFGSPAIFGGQSAFGATAFGGGSVFGGTATPAASSSFSSDSKSVFGNKQDSSSFGSIAQNQNKDEAFGKSSFGGNSFSSWR